MSRGYRPEIDGLRGVAIVPVVLYHAGVPFVSGGYIGVDVFFVISGYLITRILAGDIAAGRFSILTFYERRIRRIFPALFTMLAVSTGLAWWILLAPELKDFGQSLLAATLFVSNQYFMGDTGYFAAPAVTTPLLHLWSLAVEEQFYILFPVYLFLMTRHRGGRLVAVTSGLLIASLAASIALTFYEPDMAFYSAPTRAWELLAGSMLALRPPVRPLSTRLRQLLGLGGLLMIALAVFTYTDATSFPGIAAVLPVLGAVVVIYATAGERTWAGALLSLPPVRFVGLISYSLYLWHWPLLVFYRLWRIEPASPGEIAGVVAVAVLLSVLSWYFVERPFRKRTLLPTRPQILRGGAATMAAGVACGLTLVMADGFASRYPANVAAILAANQDRPGRGDCDRVRPKAGRVFRICPIGAKGEKPSFAVWGDSHAEALLSGFSAAGERTGRAGIFLGRVGCPPLLGVARLLRRSSECANQGRAIVAYLEARPEIERIILVARWALYATGEPFGHETDRRELLLRDADAAAALPEQNRAIFERGLNRTFASLRGMGREVMVVTQAPETEFDLPVAMARARWLGRELEFRPLAAAYMERQSLVRALFDDAAKRYDIKIARLGELLCQDERCTVSDESAPIYFDSNHLTGRYATSLAGQWEPFLTGSINPVTPVLNLH